MSDFDFGRQRWLVPGIWGHDVNPVVPDAGPGVIVCKGGVQSIRETIVGPPVPVRIGDFKPAYLPISGIVNTVARDVEMVSVLSVIVAVETDRVVITYDSQTVRWRVIPGLNDIFTSFGRTCRQLFHVDQCGAAGGKTGDSTGCRAIKMIEQVIFQEENTLLAVDLNGIHLFQTV